MYIKETFLKLTSKTYPHGFESELDELLIDGLKVDEFGNKYILIGESTCMFTSHLDTATSVNTTVSHVIEGNIIKTDGTSILGADDKAGVTIMSYMIKNKIPGLYYFFLGEEVGCVGSRKLSTKLKEYKEEGGQRASRYCV
jgi:putative aminopeptidase FrvX